MLSILWIVLIVIASLVFSNVYWSCVLYTLSILWIVLILIASLVFSNVYWSCVLYTLCCQFSGLIASLVFSNVYWSCVLYTLCCQFSGLSLLYYSLFIASLVFSNFGLFLVLCLVYLMLSILWIVLIVIASLVFSNVYLSCVLYTLCCQFSGLSLLVFSNVYCLCCQFWIVLIVLPLLYSPTFIGPVSCIPYVVNSLDCPYFDCLFGIL